MAKSKKATGLCPECHGDGHVDAFDAGAIVAVECFNCLGTGFDDDSDTFEAIYKYDDWK